VYLLLFEFIPTSVSHKQQQNFLCKDSVADLSFSVLDFCSHDTNRRSIISFFYVAREGAEIIPNTVSIAVVVVVIVLLLVLVVITRTTLATTNTNDIGDDEKSAGVPSQETLRYFL
jgi:hypothetical protein